MSCSVGTVKNVFGLTELAFPLMKAPAMSVSTPASQNPN